MQQTDFSARLSQYGDRGVRALEAATPKDSGDTAHSWSYKVTKEKGYYSIAWFNDHVQNESNIAILLQYGHGTGTGGYVEGRDYINPAMQPIFDQMANELWKEVTNG